MKCIILAGGTGDSLWPLSRKNYPKQFMDIREGHSLFQETIVRNMSFCNEFIIVTNANYRHTIKSQLSVFQGLRYRIVYEEQPSGTLAAVTLGTSLCNQSEIVLVTVSDIVIADMTAYKEDIIAAKADVQNGHIINFVDGYNHERIGMFVSVVGELSRLIRKDFPNVYDICKGVRKNRALRHIRAGKDVMDQLPDYGIQSHLFKESKDITAMEVHFPWNDIDTIRDVAQLNEHLYRDHIIENNCENVCVINTAATRLVVADNVKDVAVVSTPDATYITKNTEAGNAKEILENYHEQYHTFFDDGIIAYRTWGLQETLAMTATYKVKRVTVYPEMSMEMHKHEHRSEHWVVASGNPTVTLEKFVKEYKPADEIFVPMGISHKVENTTDEKVVIIETCVGDILKEADLIGVDNIEHKKIQTIPDIVKLEPAFKDSLWGGNKLRTVYHKQCDYECLAESWELSAHPAGQSVIADGAYKGMYFGEFLDAIGKAKQGWKCESLDRFPILIKFIDAKQALSIQIHPDDEYALSCEGEYGKNEMWYVVDAEPGAYIYCGLSRETSKEEIARRIADNTITDILNKMEVKPGDCVFVKVGTIHAIGAGLLICEIQQNSNCTYRMYDYDRRDKFGNARELHVEKALDVVNVQAYKPVHSNEKIEVCADGSEVTKLVSCVYFECYKYDVKETVKVQVTESSFVSIMIISGTGTIAVGNETYEFVPADSYFVTAGRKTVTITGACEVIVTRV